MAEAFALVDEYAGTIAVKDGDDTVDVPKFRGASLSLPDGATFDVAEALQDGDGVIVTDDGHLAEHLRALGSLKTVPVPDGHPTVTPLAELTVTALRDMPEASQVTGAGRMKHAELVARIMRVRNGEDPNVELVDRDGEYVQDETPNAGGDES